MKEPLFTEENSILLARSDGCSVYQFRNVAGDGTMTCYEVFPGTMLSFNNFHMTYFDSEYTPGRELFAIDHCREGKMEYLAVENTYAYIGASDIKLDRRLTHTGQYPGVIHEKGATEHIFGELYQVPEKIRILYFKIKILELLLYTDALELPKTREERPYYYKTQVEKVKSIQAFLIEHMAENHTLEELSDRFEIPLTGMKNCFRSVYGTSIKVWLTDYRMNQAAEFLRTDREKSVADRFLHAPLGEVQSHSIGEIKNIMIDKIEGIEPPLAHVVLESAGHIVLPVISIVSLAVIDWRIALASLVTFPAAFVCMALTFWISGKNLCRSFL